MSSRRILAFGALGLLVVGAYFARQNLAASKELQSPSPQTATPVGREAVSNRSLIETSEILGSLRSILANRANLPEDEDYKQLMALKFSEHNSVAELREALRMIPNDQQSFGLYNSLTFYLFQKDFKAALAALREAREHDAFPEQWLSGTISDNIRSLAKTDRMEALHQALTIDWVGPAEVSWGKLVNSALDQATPEEAPVILDTVLAVPEKSPFEDAVSSVNFWKLALESGRGQEVMDATKGRGIELSNGMTFALGRALGGLASFEEGRGLLGSLASNDKGALQSFYAAWFEKDAGQALKDFDQLDERTRDDLLYSNARQIAAYDVETAKKLAAATGYHLTRNSLLRAVDELQPKQ